MAEFIYNNVKKASTDHIPFELNCVFHFQASYKEDVPRSKSKSVVKLTTELKELTVVYRKNLHHAQELQKQNYDKHAKPRTYAPGNKICFNSQYIKTK